jgi:tRNA1(Val) A37 N6-methylase TrmN6
MITYLVISRRYPDAARRQRLNRNAAARRAFARLDSANRAPDPLLELQRLLIAYLHQRHGLSETVSTADEVKSDLKTRGASVTVQRQQEIVEILEACDQQRFAASPQTPAVLAKLFTRVRVLIEAWEGESPS